MKNNAVELILSFIDQQTPGLWKHVYPRSYEHLGNFHSPKIAAASLANAVISARALGLDASAGVRNQYTVAALCDAHQVPTFFVTNSVLQSANQTELPNELRWVDIPMPHPGITFVFEQGAVTHPQMGAIAFALVGRPRRGDTIQHSYPGSPRADMGAGGFIMVTGGHELTNFDHVDLAMSEVVSPTIGHLDAISIVDHDIVPSFESILTADEKVWNRWLTLLCFKLILIMNARPELVSRGQLQRTVKPKRTGEPKKEFWTPNILGKHYAIQTEGKDVPAVAGSKVRMHWRRGHFRQQPYGPNHTLRKTIWIEPTLIGTTT